MLLDFCCVVVALPFVCVYVCCLIVQLGGNNLVNLVNLKESSSGRAE